jgi:hypothetical protein
MCKPLTFGQIEFSLLSFFNVEVNADPEEQLAVPVPVRLCATEKPAIYAVDVAYSKSELTGRR